jgi:uncharacterized protein (TIGR03546 family)
MENRTDVPIPTFYRPLRLGLAVACGMLIGLIPKQSVLVLVLAALVFFSPISLPVTVASAVLCSLLANSLDTWTDAVGFWALMQPAVQPLWQSLNTPVVTAWLRWNNSVVVGSTLIGIAAFLPTVLATKWVSQTAYRVFGLGPNRCESVSAMSHAETECEG